MKKPSIGIPLSNVHNPGTLTRDRAQQGGQAQAARLGLSPQPDFMGS